MTITPAERRRTGRIGRIVAASFATGLGVAVAAVLAPFVPAEENVLTGAVLLSFALGWGLLAGLSTRSSDQPQRWAVVPAVFMGLAGTVVLAEPAVPAAGALDWVWPPALLVLVVWVFLQARRQLFSRTRLWLLNPVLAVLAVAAIGGAYEVVGQVGPTPDMPGRLVDVGGRDLHLHCTGSGSPTVVLEPGAGEMSSGFGWIAPSVAADTRVCVYDRAGRGWSDPADGPQDGAEIAADLHTLLHRAHVPGPYVLAGHSFGGLYVLTFAARYPDEVDGLVLLDTTAPASRPAPAATASSYGVLGRVSALVSASTRLGAGRLVGRVSYGTLPPRSREEAEASAATAAAAASTVEEYGVARSSMEEAAALVDLGSKPLFVLTAGRGHDDTWRSDQDDLATLSTGSLHRTVAEATHGSLVLDEHDAAASSQAIRDVVAAVRGGTTLAGP